MRQLFEIDLKDYPENGKPYYRPSARGIYLQDGKIALVYSTVYQYYKFPGGGIHADEDKKEALLREFKEETGLEVLPDSVREFGSVLRKQKSNEGGVFIQENFYYFCTCRKNIQSQRLDAYELEAGFTLKWVTIDEAIKVNRRFQGNSFDIVMIERERRVLELLLEEQIC